MYAFVRHPEFLGHILIIFALVLIAQHLVSLVTGALLILGIVFDRDAPLDKECVLWSGKSFVKEKSQEQRAVEIATAHLSFPVTIIEVIKLECQGCFSVKLQRDDNQRQFTIVLDNWKIKN